MTRARGIRELGNAEGHTQCVAKLRCPGDIVVDHRGVARALVMLCPDGCGDVLTVNLDRRAGKAWRIDRRNEKLTVYPSVWRAEGCRAHFIIWRGRVLWCDWREGPDPDDDALRNQVERALAAAGRAFVEYETLAEALGENPWDVAWACRMLVRVGRAEAEGNSRFRLKPGGPTSGNTIGRWA